jgi:hypothetical protein
LRFCHRTFLGCTYHGRGTERKGIDGQALQKVNSTTTHRMMHTALDTKWYENSAAKDLRRATFCIELAAH